MEWGDCKIEVVIHWVTLVQPIKQCHLATVSSCIYVFTVFVKTYTRTTYAEGRKINSMEEPGVHEILQLAENILAMRVTEKVKTGNPVRSATFQ